jgi:hypothetical protein
MKKTELKTGVRYAYQTGEHRSVEEVVILDLDRMWRAERRGCGRHDDAPMYAPANPTLHKVPSREVGYLAVTKVAPAHRPVSTKALLKITVKDVEALTFAHQAKGYEVHLVNPRYVLGEYDEVVQQQQEQQERRMQAEKNRQERRLLAQKMIRDRADLLVSLGLPGRTPYQSVPTYPPADLVDMPLSLTIRQFDALLERVRAADKAS